MVRVAVGSLVLVVGCASMAKTEQRGADGGSLVCQSVPFTPCNPAVWPICPTDWKTTQLKVCDATVKSLLARCGRYYAATIFLTQQQLVLFYDDTGKFVGRYWAYAGGESCESYDPSFVRSPIRAGASGCVTIPMACGNDAGREGGR